MPTAPPGPAFRPLRDDFAVFGVLQARVQRLFQTAGRDHRDGFFFGDETFADHFDGDANRGGAGALAAAALQDEQLVLFDGELDVLHILIVVFEALGVGDQFVVNRFVVAFEFGDFFAGCAHRPRRLRPARWAGIRRKSRSRRSRRCA